MVAHSFVGERIQKSVIKFLEIADSHKSKKFDFHGSYLCTLFNVYTFSSFKIIQKIQETHSYVVKVYYYI